MKSVLVGAACTFAVLLASCDPSERNGAHESVADTDTSAAPETAIACDPALPSVDATEWRQLAELDPCAPAYASRNPAKSAPAWKWIPCTNGAPNCEEFEANWRNEFPGYFGGASVAADAAGRMERLLIMRLFDADHPFGTVGWEEDLFDISTGKALAVVRTIAWKTPMYVDIGVGATALESFWSGDSQRRTFYFGSAPAKEIAAEPALAFSARRELGFDSCFNIVKTVSTSTWACSDPEHRHIARMDVKSGAVVAVPVPRPLHLITVNGGDAYYRENRNAQDWARIVRLDKGGTLHTLRDPGARHVTSFATDGRTMFWLEAYGDPSPVGSTPQPTLEAWSAPYSNDDATLASTAKPLATLERSEYKNNVPGTLAVAFGGVYAAATGVATIQLVRSDGRTKVLRDFLGADRTVYSIVTVSETELWVLTEKTGTNQRDGLVRIRLVPW